MKDWMSCYQPVIEVLYSMRCPRVVTKSEYGSQEIRCLTSKGRFSINLSSRAGTELNRSLPRKRENQIIKRKTHHHRVSKPKKHKLFQRQHISIRKQIHLEIIAGRKAMRLGLSEITNPTSNAYFTSSHQVVKAKHNGFQRIL